MLKQASNRDLLNILKDPDIRRVSPGFIKRYAKQIDHPDADAIFLSCGALRSTEIIDEIEKEVGKPVVGSNQSMLWNTLRMAGIEDRLEGCAWFFLGIGAL